MSVILRVTKGGQTTEKKITTGLGDVKNIKRVLNFMFPDISTEQDPKRQAKRDEEARTEYLANLTNK